MAGVTQNISSSTVRATEGAPIDELSTTITLSIDTSQLEELLGFEYLNSEMETLIETKINNLEKLHPVATEVLGNSLKEWIEYEIKNKNLIHTGNMLGNVYSQPDGSDRLVYLSASTIDGYPYPVGLEFGTRPHLIEGNPWLWWEGASHPVRRVNHPGNAPNPFVAPARELFKAAADSVVEGAFEGKW